MSRKTLFCISLVLVMVLTVGIVGACSTSTPTAPATSSAPGVTTPATTPVQASPTKTAPPSTTAPSSTAPVQQITLVYSDFEPAGSFWDTEVTQVWFAELEKRTGGRVKVESHFGGELYGLFDIYDALLKGSVDMAKFLPTMFADKFPMDGAMIFTPVNLHPWRSGAAWLELYNAFPEMQAQYKNTPLIGLAPTPCFGLATTKKEIHKWEDAKGLKMVGAGPAPESRQKAIGIVPVSLPPSDMYMGLKTGTLDGLAVQMHSLEDFKWVDVLPYMTVACINGGVWSFGMSQKAWNNLPPDIQQTMTDMIPWVTELVDQVAYKMDQESLNTFPQKYGTKIIELSQAEADRWAEVDGPTLDAYIAEYVTAKGLPGDRLKTEFLRVMQKYSAEEYKFK
ncbi:MAG: TRAP transporter substrate-binding protein DctP [Dehalococcoidales bacterium]|nr:TRAP transporter substrate-binding protein DctP [Dehalococcoidales bacterium]